jgi:DNA-binding winged helix-turn-helix (wHTH) protein
MKKFGGFRYNPASGELYQRNRKITILKPKVAKTLEVLLEHRGEVVDKDSLLKAVWPDTVVEESNLTHIIWELRQHLGDESIETIPKRGYRFRPAPARQINRRRAVALAVVAAGTILWTLRNWPSPRGAAQASGETFSIYSDAAAPENHFYPTGYMGDCGDLEVDEASRDQPHRGQTCIRVSYTPKGLGPNACPYPAPCRWAGIYWQHPPRNWGTEAKWKGQGFNLSGYTRLRFWARANPATAVEFKTGGIAAPYGDSLQQARAIFARLETAWREFEIDLAGADLSHIIGGFCLVTNWAANPQPVTLYLDEIRFERR